ncbi:concanavalin A-like lectin/glucanase domain-containing protein [Apodospora peruviana]|uniref:Concanavalin A-like lectin/glucanase domain-containing protein n=1 Tax=Apodospora peruviana TaxID=516989 RepID=A0AAE0IE61_9PEZI|nr:concanavalin A-like lectin/glucanase domain-containing protein [Apodospora peruviana]
MKNLTLVFVLSAFNPLVSTQFFIVAAKTIIIPSTSFNSQADFDAEWGYNYPWGTDHNGAARMAKSQVQLEPNATLTLTAKKASGEKAATHGGKQIPIKYLSGTVYAKEYFTVTKGGGYDFAAELRATVTKGTWPAFWLTGVKGWPPEIDMAEWKGSGKISFNTFNTSSQVRARDVAYPSPNEFHSILCEVRDAGNGRDVSARFTMDGKVIETQYGKGFIGQSMYLIIDLQMEGSSGSPGPNEDTLFQVRNLEVTSYNP